MDSVLDLFLNHYDQVCQSDTPGLAEPIPIEQFSKSGMSDKDLVVYLRFIDLLRSAAMVSRFCYVGGVKENRSLVQETMKKTLQSILDDYKSFICSICQVEEPAPILAFQILLFRGDYKSKLFPFDYADMSFLYLSFDDFRAQVEIDTAIMLQGKLPGIQVRNGDEDKKEAETLSTQALDNSIEKIEEQLFQLSLHEDDEVEMPERITYFDVIKEAKILYDEGCISDYIKSLENKLTAFKAEREQRRISSIPKPPKKKVKKKVAAIKKAAPQQPIVKCTRCGAPAFREGYCWFHYQQEHYTSR